MVDLTWSLFTFSLSTDFVGRQMPMQTGSDLDCSRRTSSGNFKCKPSSRSTSFCRSLVLEYKTYCASIDYIIQINASFKMLRNKTYNSPIYKWSSLWVNGYGLVVSPAWIFLYMKDGGPAAESGIHTDVEPGRAGSSPTWAETKRFIKAFTWDLLPYWRHAWNKIIRYTRIRYS